jgi:two-component system response regulator AtoC
VIRTLIVEDNATFRRSLSDMLRAHYPSMLVSQAENLGDARKKIAEIQPGLVFVDIKLHDENGLDLAREIRKMNPDTTVAVMTALNIPEYRQAAFDHGAHFFIPKDSATFADFVKLVDSVQTGRPPQWGLGPGSINPSALGRPGRK